ncbi:MAG: Smr/MutS family protein [Pseudomonadota bacterium]
MRRGNREPDARLDLHGLTAERAHRVLDGFLARALAENLRCLLVITGKGGKAPGKDAAGFARSDLGVLRQMVPRWLRAGRYRSQIVGIFEAHLRHGGAGAIYVYLKKRR